MVQVIDKQPISRDVGAVHLLPDDVTIHTRRWQRFAAAQVDQFNALKDNLPVVRRPMTVAEKASGSVAQREQPQPATSADTSQTADRRTELSPAMRSKAVKIVFDSVKQFADTGSLPAKITQEQMLGAVGKLIEASTLADENYSPIYREDMRRYAVMARHRLLVQANPSVLWSAIADFDVFVAGQEEVSRSDRPLAAMLSEVVAITPQIRSVSELSLLWKSLDTIEKRLRTDAPVNLVGERGEQVADWVQRARMSTIEFVLEAVTKPEHVFNLATLGEEDRKQLLELLNKYVYEYYKPDEQGKRRVGYMIAKRRQMARLANQAEVPVAIDEYDECVWDLLDASLLRLLLQVAPDKLSSTGEASSVIELYATSLGDNFTRVMNNLKNLSGVGRKVLYTAHPQYPAQGYYRVAPRVPSSLGNVSYGLRSSADHQHVPRVQIASPLEAIRRLRKLYDIQTTSDACQFRQLLIELQVHLGLDLIASDFSFDDLMNVMNGVNDIIQTLRQSADPYAATKHWGKVRTGLLKIAVRAAIDKKNQTVAPVTPQALRNPYGLRTYQAGTGFKDYEVRERRARDTLLAMAIQAGLINAGQITDYEQTHIEEMLRGMEGEDQG